MAMGASSHTSTLLPPRPSLFSLSRSSPRSSRSAFSSSAKALFRRELHITQRPHSVFPYATVYRSFFQLKHCSYNTFQNNRPIYSGELAIYHENEKSSSKARMLIVPAQHSYHDSSSAKHHFDVPWTRIEGENGQGHRRLNLPTSYKPGFSSDMRSNASGSPPRSQETNHYSGVGTWKVATNELKRKKEERFRDYGHAASKQSMSLNLTSQNPPSLFSYNGNNSQATYPTISVKSNFQGDVSTVDVELVSHSKQTRLAVEDMSCRDVQHNEPLQEVSLKVGEKIDSEQTGGGSFHSNEKGVIKGKTVGEGKIRQQAPRQPAVSSLKSGKKKDSEQTGGGRFHSNENGVINGKTVGEGKIRQQAPHQPAVSSLKSGKKKDSEQTGGGRFHSNENGVINGKIGQQAPRQPAVSSLKSGKKIDSEQTGSGSFHSNKKGVIDGKTVSEEKIGQQAPHQPADSFEYVIVEDVIPDSSKRLSTIYDDVLVVNTVSAAKEVVQMLTDQFRHHVHACDTEVAKIDVKQETPVDHGEIICFSIYSGPEADFGNGKSTVWVDVLDGGGRDILLEFAPFFEDPSIKKVWHNYSFDNHVLENYGFKLSGFHADTMHMARLWDSSRRTQGGYSLEALSGDSRVMSGAKLCSSEKELIGKISMKTIFGTKKLKKDGSEGKVVTMAPVEELQRNKHKLWVSYSALDAISTLKLYESLKSKLARMPWKFNDTTVHGKTMFDFYEEYWRPFGELLVKMETEGMLVDRAYLAELEKVAKREQEVAVNRFRNWASKYCPDARYMNVGSDIQLRQLFFGGIQNRNNCEECLPHEKIFKIPNVENVLEEGKKAPAKLRSIKLHQIGVNFTTEIFTASGWPSVSGEALKALAGKVSAVYDFKDVDDDLLLDDAEIAVTEDVDTSAYGSAFAAFVDSGYKEEDGREACHAIAALCEVCSIDSLISNFILPLQGSNVSGKNGRVHCSLNINTETGRLSARRPNLQNQPALEKDRYKIRQAFIAAPGNSLVVADYGQLELRILAHLANCKSMLDAFKAGGDFHSRTAMNMYPHIREAVEKKQVLLEWDPQPGEDKPPVPLLKDAFASERRKAKMLNFSIAYGKTPVGLARDWKVSVKEAEETVNLWYKERQEVLAWQQLRKIEAIQDGCVHTLLGRARRFPSTLRATRAHKNHIERAAINTPVQGSAADVAMCAMIEISKNPRLKELGWKLILQVHDEVILEGPTESAEIAKDIVVDCMSKPFKGKNILKVDLAVDAKCAGNWYAAK